MTKRKNEISLLSVLYCLLVIFIHCTGGAVSLLPFDNLARFVLYTFWKLSSFVVQGFIFLSAMKHFMKESSKPYHLFILDKLKKIFLPYVLWCLVYYFSYVAVDMYVYDTGKLLKGIFIGDICGHFYYIIIIMQFYLLFPLWKKLFKKDNVLIVLPAVILFSAVCAQGLPIIINVMFPNFNFIYNDRLFSTYLVYWAFGCYAGLYYEEFKALVLKNKGFICVMFALAALGNVALPHIAQKYGYSMPFLSDLQVLYSIMAIVFTFMIALMIRETKFAKSAVITSVDRASYGIYLSHCLILSAVDVYIVIERSLMPLDATAVRYLTVYPASILLCCGYDYIRKVISQKLIKK